LNHFTVPLAMIHPLLTYKLKSQKALLNKKGHKAKSLCGLLPVQKLLTLRLNDAIDAEELSIGISPNIIQK